jgi:hypothetical protein
VRVDGERGAYLGGLGQRPTAQYGGLFFRFTRLILRGFPYALLWPGTLDKPNWVSRDLNS